MKHRCGFTLVEVLIVIGIIAVVAAVVFPVFATARERGRRAACQNNLRQIATAMEMYVHDNDGQYPLQEFWNNSVFPYLKDKRVFECPDNPRGYEGLLEGPLSPFDSGSIDYAFDVARLNVFPPPYPSKAVRGASEAMIAFPSDTLLNMDICWIDAEGSHFTRDVTSFCGRTISGNTLHSGGGDYSFVDGHVRWLTPEQFGEIDCAVGPVPAPFNSVNAGNAPVQTDTDRGRDSGRRRGCGRSSSAGRGA